MTDAAQRTLWALQKFAGFVERWTGPATLDPRRSEYADVANAIRAIAPPIENPIVGYAVFAQRPDRERECGFEHIAVSAVFDEPPTGILPSIVGRAEKVLAKPPAERERQLADGSLVRLDELRGFVICRVEQISTNP